MAGIPQCVILGSVLLLLLQTPSITQTKSSDDWTLASLRGEWDVHTIRHRWTLAFNSDSDVIVKRRPALYSLIPGGIRVDDEGVRSDYLLTLSGNSLTLRDPDGVVRSYKRIGPGESEKNLNGRFYAVDGTDDVMSFDGDRIFQVTVGPGEAHTTGRFRVEGEIILLCYPDGDVDEARIRYREDDGSVTGIVCDDRLFEMELLIVQEPSVPPIVIYPTSDPFPYPPPFAPGGPYPIPPRPPYQPPPPPQRVAPETPPADGSGQDKHRDFGNGRTGKPGRP